jgi:hypothetical protein
MEMGSIREYLSVESRLDTALHLLGAYRIAIACDDQSVVTIPVGRNDL